MSSTKQLQQQEQPTDTRKHGHGVSLSDRTKHSQMHRVKSSMVMHLPPDAREAKHSVPLPVYRYQVP